MNVDMDDTRMVFSAEIQPGMTILQRCQGRICQLDGCPLYSTAPGLPRPEQWHTLTVLRRLKDVPSAICVDEFGHQQSWFSNGFDAVRILMATDPLRNILPA